MVSETVEAAFGMLAQMERPHGGRTVEGLVTELIRPLLKTWLDDNLPALAERLVRAEIARISHAKRLNADRQEDRRTLLRDMPPEPPRDLSPREAEIWRATVDEMKAQDLIDEFCAQANKLDMVSWLVKMYTNYLHNERGQRENASYNRSHVECAA